MWKMYDNSIVFSTLLPDHTVNKNLIEWITGSCPELRISISSPNIINESIFTILGGGEKPLFDLEIFTRIKD